MNRATIFTLKALIIAMILLLLVAQVLAVPQSAANTAERFPEAAYLVTPGIVISVLFILCVQIVLVCVWRMLSLVSDDRIFSEKAFRYVDIIIGTIIVAVVLIVVALVILTIAGTLPPSVGLLCVFGIVIGAGLALLVGVLRGLLRKALQLEQDLAEVV